MHAFTFLAVLASIVVVSAQSSTVTSDAAMPTDMTQCVNDCSTVSAIQVGCTAYTDFQCVCPSQEFQTVVDECLQHYCTQAERESAAQRYQIDCAAYTNVTSSASASVSSTLASIQSSFANQTASIRSQASSAVASATSALGSSLSARVSSATSSSSAAGAAVALPGLSTAVAVGVLLMGAIAGSMVLFA